MIEPIVYSWYRQAGKWMRTTGAMFKGGMRVTVAENVTPPLASGFAPMFSFPLGLVDTLETGLILGTMGPAFSFPLGLVDTTDAIVFGDLRSELDAFAIDAIIFGNMVPHLDLLHSVRAQLDTNDRVADAIVPTNIKSWQRERGELVRTDGNTPKGGMLVTATPEGDPPSQVTGLSAVPGDTQIALNWDTATDDIEISHYELQYRINRQIISLDGTYTYPNAEALQSVLMVRYGIFGINYLGMTTLGVLPATNNSIVSDINSWCRVRGEWVLCAGVIPKDGMQVIPTTHIPDVPDVPIEGTFVSFSRESFTDVTFEDIEIGARFVSGNPGFVIRSNNGAGPYGWSSYAAIFSESTVKIYEVVMGVLGNIKAAHIGYMTGKWCALRAEGTRISIRVDDIEVCYFESSTYYNGVVGLTCGPAGGVWDFSLNTYEDISRSINRNFTHTNLINGLEYEYRVRAFDTPGWASTLWSDLVHATPRSSFTGNLPAERVTVGLGELVITTSPAPTLSITMPNETVTGALQELTIVVRTIEQASVNFNETVTAGLQELAVVVRDIAQTPVNFNETVTAALNTLTIVVRNIEQTPVNFNETVTATLTGLAITVADS